MDEQRVQPGISASQSFDSELLPLICRLADGELSESESRWLSNKVTSYPELSGIVDFLQLIRNGVSYDQAARAKAEKEETEFAYEQLMKRLNEEEGL